MYVYNYKCIYIYICMYIYMYVYIYVYGDIRGKYDDMIWSTDLSFFKVQDKKPIWYDTWLSPKAWSQTRTGRDVRGQNPTDLGIRPWLPSPRYHHFDRWYGYHSKIGGYGIVLPCFTYINFK